jgi:soluble lytic murein transglycosylase-like protein
MGGSKRYLQSNIKGGADIDAGSPSALASPANRQDAIGNIFAQHRCRESPLDPKSIEQLIVAAANKYGVDPKLATAVGWNESRFDRLRNSPKGARGPMQLVPDTARRFGVRDICDPASNIDGGVHYLRTLLDKFGNPLLAAAAYNAGEQAIYDHRGVPPFAETVTYLANILNYQMGLRAPSGSKSDPQPKLSRTDQPAPDTAGVIGASTRAKFIAGVMQF